MVWCTWVCMHKTIGLNHGFVHTDLYIRIVNMKRKDTKSKALSSCFSGKSILLYLGGARFEPCLFPFVCTQIFLGHYFHYMWICLILYLRLSFSSYFQHANVHGWPSSLSHCTFSISSIPYNFHAIAKNLHDTWTTTSATIAARGIINMGGEEYEVDRILDSRLCQWRLQYLVLWKGYPLSDATWELVTHLQNASEAIHAFPQRCPHKLDTSVRRQP